MAKQRKKKTEEQSSEIPIENPVPEVTDNDTYRVRDYDLLFNITGIVGLAVFLFMVYAVMFLKIPADNKEVVIQLIGMCQGVALSIFGYFFGSSIKRNNQ